MAWASFCSWPRATGLYRQAVHGLRKTQRLEVEIVFIVRVVKDGVVMDVVHLGHGADITGYAVIHLLVLTALHFEQVSDLEGFAAVANEHLGIRFNRALVNTENTELADKGVVADLEYMSDHVTVLDPASLRFPVLLLLHP